jgi:hypothetical protein
MMHLVRNVVKPIARTETGLFEAIPILSSCPSEKLLKALWWTVLLTPFLLQPLQVPFISISIINIIIKTR